MEERKNIIADLENSLAKLKKSKQMDSTIKKEVLDRFNKQYSTEKITEEKKQLIDAFKIANDKIVSDQSLTQEDKDAIYNANENDIFGILDKQSIYDMDNEEISQINDEIKYETLQGIQKRADVLKKQQDRADEMVKESLKNYVKTHKIQR